MVHKILHWFTGRWEDIEHLPMPEYASLYRQRCNKCGSTRVQDIIPAKSDR